MLKILPTDKAPGHRSGLWVLAAALLLFCSEASAVSPFDEVGRLHVQNFAAEDYGALTQNWAVVQSPEDLIYVANASGVLEYDGVSWRLIPVANHSAARSLALGSDGRIYVGGVDELGYLAPDSLGALHYVSMLDHIQAADREFADIWSIAKTSEGLFFQANQRLFRWDGQTMQVLHADTRFVGSFVLEDVFYVRQEDIGLMRRVEGALTMAPGGEFFADTHLSGLVPWDTGWLLAVTRDRGLYRCPSEDIEGACVPFRSDLTELLAPLQPRHATLLPNEILAIPTARGGVVLLDRVGRLLRIVNKASGLRDEIVWASHLDRQGGLWLAFNDGLARVEILASVSTLGKSVGLPGSVFNVARHRGRLYAATPLGVSVLEPATEGEAPRFVAVPGVEAQCWSLLSTEQGLLAACFQGVYNLDQRRLVWPFRDRHVLRLFRSRVDPTQLYLGLQDGLARMELRDGAWRDAGRLDGVEYGVRTIAEDDAGQIWLGIHPDGLLRVTLADSPGEPPDIRHFDSEDGLPLGEIRPTAIAGEMRFLSGTGEGLFRMESKSEGTLFVPDPSFDAFVPQSLIDGLIEDERGRLWFVSKELSGVAEPTADGNYRFAPVAALRRITFVTAYGMWAEVEGATWLWGPHGISRLDTTSDFAERQEEARPEPIGEYPVWIRRVMTSGGASLYEGRRLTSQEDAVEISYDNNALRLTFAAPRYDAPERTLYRTRLEGFESEWSAWVDETDRDFTNLWEGRYVFRVQARDAYGMLSREDSFRFKILPPWYRAWWAYTFYGLALVGIALAYARYHRRELKRERRISRRLREIDKLKDEFLANTSHELRTPLNGITGLAESLMDGVTGELPGETQNNLSMIVHSGRRLSRLIDDILDFSKLRHKSLELDLRPVDLGPLVDVVLTLSRPLLGTKALKLINAVSADLPAAMADENRLQQILHNLVGNAIKFTDAGTIEVSAGLEDAQLTVRVADTGIGIPAEKQEQVFDAFEQADASVEREYGGTGLGLAVSRQLVELHGGEIWVDSAVGRGSSFAFTLPVAQGASEALRIAPQPPVPTPRPQAASHPETAKAETGAARILAVDDDPINLQVLNNYLAVEHFDLTLASSGDEALRRLEEQTFDLVLLDVMMPRLSGYEVCRALREKHPIADLPVVFLTAKGRDSDVVTGMALGANDYLTKPISKDRLMARMRPHLELLHAHRHLEDLVEERMSQVKMLSGLLPICSGCKMIRDDEGYWNELELFIDHHSEAEFTHGICPKCTERFYANQRKKESGEASNGEPGR